MKNIMKSILMLLISNVCFSQSWQLLPNSPSAGFRHDDICFISADTGWVVNVDGYIYKTTDGGNSFITQLYQPATSFRCAGFANSSKGWAGNLGPGAWNPTSDTLPLYQTVDGGNTWQPVLNISGPLPKGICGISVVDDNTVYAVGRVGGPCHIMKTINGGTSWTSVNFNPPAFYLIDCKFFSPDTGFVVGCTGTSYADERYAIFYTTDGGTNWQTVCSTATFNGHCWKVFFPSRQIGYASIEASFGTTDSVPVLKTIDGGLTWSEKLWSVPVWYAQGIGFINDTRGWCGNLLNEVKETNDGGDTWNVVSFAENFNRFRKINDTIAYASGNRIWKYTSQSVGINAPVESTGIILHQNLPNPFSERTSIKYFLPVSGHVLLKVYDLAGRPVKTLVNENQSQGEHQVQLSLPYFHDAHFYYTLSFENVLLTRQALMIKNK